MLRIIVDDIGLMDLKGLLSISICGEWIIVLVSMIFFVMLVE